MRSERREPLTISVPAPSSFHARDHPTPKLYMILLSIPPHLLALLVLPPLLRLLRLLLLLLMLTRITTCGTAIHVTYLYVAILRVRGYTSQTPGGTTRAQRLRQRR